MSVGSVCEQCRHTHCSGDARAVGRFNPGGAVGYRATDVPGAPLRATRAEAAADKCAHRARRGMPTLAVVPKVTTAPQIETAPRRDVEPQPFPAALMETAARGKAWCDFLAQARLSLLVWEIDENLHAEIEHVTVWLRRCSSELADLVTPMRPRTPARRRSPVDETLTLFDLEASA